MATVIGPTPPGTGVMYPATSLTLSKSTSPHNFCDATFVIGSITDVHNKKRKQNFVAASKCKFVINKLSFNCSHSPEIELIPQSITSAPGLTQSPFTKLALPIATTKISASRTLNERTIERQEPIIIYRRVRTTDGKSFVFE